MHRLSIGDALTGILAICAVVVTGLLIHQQFRPAQASGQFPTRDVSSWRSFAAPGHRMGPANGPVTIIEFSDFQCPFCRQSASEIDSIMRLYPDKITHVYRYFPLAAVHRHAMMAAVAAECAGQQGRFRAFHDALFADQEALGTRPWVAFAVSAGVADTTLFAHCIADSARVMPRIRVDIAAGQKLGVVGTPALLINDHFFSGVPSEDQLRQMVAAAIVGR